MKSLLWFVLGIAGGFVLAHLMDKDPRGHEVLAEIDARISEFTDRIQDAYREQEAKITGSAATAPTAVDTGAATPSSDGQGQAAAVDTRPVD